MASVTADQNLQAIQQILSGAVTLAPNVTFRDEAQCRTAQGKPAVESSLRALFIEAFPGVRLPIRTAIADAHVAVLEFTFDGVQRGSFMGIPPTGRRVTVPMVLIYRLAEGAVEQMTLYYDAGSFLRQLGIVSA